MGSQNGRRRLPTCWAGCFQGARRLNSGGLVSGRPLQVAQCLPQQDLVSERHTIPRVGLTILGNQLQPV